MPHVRDGPIVANMGFFSKSQTTGWQRNETVECSCGCFWVSQAFRLGPLFRSEVRGLSPWGMLSSTSQPSGSGSPPFRSLIAIGHKREPSSLTHPTASPAAIHPTTHTAAPSQSAPPDTSAAQTPPHDSTSTTAPTKLTTNPRIPGIIACHIGLLGASRADT